MLALRRVVAVLLLLAPGLACESASSPAATPDDDGAGGAGGAPMQPARPPRPDAAAPASGVDASSAGVGGRGGSSGGSAGGAAGAGGTGGSGGATTGGAAGSGAAGSGGAGSGGAAGAPARPDGGADAVVDAAPATDAGATDAAPIPPTSAGCGNKAPPPDGLVAITVAGEKRDYYIHAPKDYDASKPYPLLYMFHGSTHSGRDYEGTTATTGEGIRYYIGPEAILIFLNAPFKTDARATQFDHRDIPFWEASLERTRATLCVDNRRIFVAGHSSGAYFAHTLGGRRPQHVRGLAAVAGALGDGPDFVPRGNPAVFVAHGRIDSVNPFSNGETARKYWAKWNGCTEVTKPATPSPCVAYEGCKAGSPVLWCPHGETAYSGTGHGWPSFATRGMWEMFKTLR